MDGEPQEDELRHMALVLPPHAPLLSCDQYLAVCNPLHYAIIMREELCICLLAGSWLLSCANALTHTLILAQMFFCADNIIPHLFCNLAVLLKLCFSDTFLNELFIFIAAAVVFFFPLSAILVSYGCIGIAILRVPLLKGSAKP